MSDTSYETIVSELGQDGVQRITLNRAEKKNAFNTAMYEELTVALESASENNSAKVVLITGAKDFYSSGNDLSVFAQMNPEDTPKLLREASARLIRFVDAWIECTKVIVCAVNGPAIGIAATTLGLADFVFMKRGAYLLTPFMKLGQSPEGCSSFMFPRALGLARANEMLLLGRKMSACELDGSGLVTRVFDADVFDERVREALDTLTAYPPETLRTSKMINRAELIETLKRVNRAEVKLLNERWASPECLESVMKFLTRSRM
jgi:Delta3-Delta2-enoyl-CoA isomerase